MWDTQDEEGSKKREGFPCPPSDGDSFGMEVKLYIFEASTLDGCFLREGPIGTLFITVSQPVCHHKVSHVPQTLTYIRKIYLEKAIHHIKLLKLKRLLLLPFCVSYIFVAIIYSHPSIVNNKR
jgi:hypothetical protein